MSESGQHRFESDPQPFATRVPLSLRHSSLYSIEYKQKKAKKNLSKTLKVLKKAKRTKIILKKVLSSFFKGSHKFEKQYVSLPPTGRTCSSSCETSAA